MKPKYTREAILAYLEDIYMNELLEDDGYADMYDVGRWNGRHDLAITLTRMLLETEDEDTDN